MENQQVQQTQTQEPTNLEQAVSSALGIENNTVTQTQEQQTSATIIPEFQTKPTAQTQEESPVKLLRQQYEATKSDLSKSNALLQRIANSRGITVEELQDAIQAEEDKRQAQNNNIPIEIQQRIRTQEEKIKNLEMQNLRNDFDLRAGKLKSEYQLNDQQVIDFAQKAEALGLNVFTPGLDLVTLFRAINYDSVVNDLKNSIRQEVLNELQNSNNTNAINNIPGTKQPDTSTKNDMTESAFLQSLLNNLGSIR